MVQPRQPTRPENKSKRGIVDWSSAQIAGIQNAFGKVQGEELLRGCKVCVYRTITTCYCIDLFSMHCQVHFLWAAHRAAEKVCSTSSDRRAFIKVASQLPNETSKAHVMTIFSCLKGEVKLYDLPQSLKVQLGSLIDQEDISTSTWTCAKSWVQWWTRPIHLRKCNESVYTGLH